MYTFILFENGVYGMVDEYFACGHRRWIWFEYYSAEKDCFKRKCRPSCLKNTTYLFLFKKEEKKSIYTLGIRKVTQFNQAGWISAEVTFIFDTPVLLFCFPWSQLRGVYICITDMKWQMSKCSWTAEVSYILLSLWRRGDSSPAVFRLSATILLHLREGSAVLPNHAQN